MNAKTIAINHSKPTQPLRKPQKKLDDPAVMKQECSTGACSGVFDGGVVDMAMLVAVDFVTFFI